MAEDHAAVVQGDFEGHPSVAAVAAGEDCPVVGQDAGWVAVQGGGSGRAVLVEGRSKSAVVSRQLCTMS
jgi:hypothetical protein